MSWGWFEDRTKKYQALANDLGWNFFPKSYQHKVFALRAFRLIRKVQLGKSKHILEKDSVGVNELFFDLTHIAANQIEKLDYSDTFLTYYNATWGTTGHFQKWGLIFYRLTYYNIIEYVEF